MKKIITLIVISILTLQGVDAQSAATAKADEHFLEFVNFEVAKIL